MVFYVSGGQPFTRMEGTGGLGFCLFCLAMRPRGLGHWHTAGTQGLLNERMNKCSSREIKQSLSPKIIQLSPCLSSKEKKYVFISVVGRGTKATSSLASHPRSKTGLARTRTYYTGSLNSFWFWELFCASPGQSGPRSGLPHISGSMTWEFRNPVT